MVKHVVEVCTNREGHPLRNLEIFQHVEVGVEVVRAAEEVPASGSETGLGPVEVVRELSRRIHTRGQYAGCGLRGMSATRWTDAIPLRRNLGYVGSILEDEPRKSIPGREWIAGSGEEGSGENPSTDDLVQ